MSTKLRLICIGLMFVFFASCGSTTSTTTNGIPAHTASNRTQYPLTLQNCGRTVTFTHAPQRVITDYQNVTEILVKLGLGDRIIGAEWSHDSPPPADIATAYSKVKMLSDQTASIEQVFNAQPDMLFASSGPDDKTLSALQTAGIPVYTMSTDCAAFGCSNCTPSTTGTIQDVYANILAIGQIFDVQAKAQAVVNEMKSKVAYVQSKIAGRTPIKAYYCLCAGGEDPQYTYGPSYVSDFIRLAGGVNIFVDQKDQSPAVSPEQVVAKNPQIFLVYLSYYDSNPATEAARAANLYKQYPTVSATMNKREVAVWNQDMGPGIRDADTVLKLAEAFFPNAFKQS